MIVRHIRLQIFIALSGMLVLMLMLGAISTTIDTLVLPEAGGTYVEGIPQRPDNLNPLYLQPTNRANHDLGNLIFNSLAQADITGLLKPELATHWEMSEDQSYYTFFLRDDVVWHDDTPFSAEDVAFTVRVIQDPAFTGNVPGIELWREVTVEVIDSTTIRFILPEEIVPFAPFLSFTTFKIIPQHVLATIPVAELANAPFSRAPVGTGAWRLVPQESDQIVLEPHAAYFGKKPMIDRLIFRFYDDIPSALRALKNGQVMGVAQIRPSDLPDMLANPSITVYSALRSGYTALFYNLRNPLFQQQDVREAMMLGLDRQALIEQVLNGQGIVANSFLMPTHWAYEPSLPSYTYQPEEASALLEEAGWEDDDGDGIRERNGKTFKFNVLTISADPELVEVVTEVTKQWQALGLQANADIVESAAELREKLNKRDFDLFVLATPLTGIPSDPDFYPLWHSTQLAENGGQNYPSFENEIADILLIEGRLTLEQEKRRVIYSDFQQILAQELPALPLYHPIYNYAINQIAKDVQIAPLNKPADRFMTLPDWYLKIQRLILPKGAPTPTIENRN